MSSSYLENLNPKQREAIETTQGPLLILAGAGTGKTRVLTTRFAHIYLSGLAQPWQILTVTFTNKAAREMRHRIEAITGISSGRLWLGTFHSICARILRRYADLVDLNSDFIILDKDDQIRLLKQIMRANDIDIKEHKPIVLASIIQRLKDRCLSPDKLKSKDMPDFADGRGLDLYQIYQQRLRALNACDFGDLMLYTTEILRKHLDILSYYQNIFRYILVDEYQDTNTIQYLWLRLLAKKSDGISHICCVGDDDQSIYSWRGAEIANILNFERDFPNAHIIKLECNYRSTAPILGAASALISHNHERLGKTLYPGLKPRKDDQKITVQSLSDSEEEADYIAQTAISLHAKGRSFSDMAVLVRAGFQTRAFEESFMNFSLPYRIIGGVRFYDRAEIKDGLAYLRCVLHTYDDLALERIINVPRRGIGTTTLQRIRDYARQNAIPLQQAIQQLIKENAIKGRQAQQLNKLLEDFKTTRTLLEKEDHQKAADYILNESGYLPSVKADKSPTAEGRAENIDEMLRALASFSSLPEFLERVSLVMDNEEAAQEEHITVMTLHGAKGLEFDVVFLPGWEDGVFPSQKAIESGNPKSIEEERRLAYVGITRARKKLFITYAARRRVFGQWQNSFPSLFLGEIPQEFIQQKQKRYFDSFRQPQYGFAGNKGANRRPAPIMSKSVPPPFQPGEMVTHPRFGSGTILHVQNDHLQIAFDQFGVKNLISSFVQKK